MRRREFIAGLGSAAAWPLVARAQQTKVWRVGYLHPGFLDSPGDRILFEEFRQELETLGYSEGKNLIIDRRGGEGKNERLPMLAAELVSLHADVIVAVATVAIAAAQRATSTIPIIMTPAIDPVGFGFVKSLTHPGGNTTGFSSMGVNSAAKSVELLHAIFPDARRIAVLMSSNPNHPKMYDLASDAATAIGLSTTRIVAATDVDQAFQEISQANCDALFILGDPIRPQIVTLAAKGRIPALYQYSEYAEIGGLATYGPSLRSTWKRSAQYAVNIFRGADPADLPVEQPTRFELVLNLKTAKALGLTIPDIVLARADRVIE